MHISNRSIVLRSQFQSSLSLAILLVVTVFLITACGRSVAQENFLVSTQDGTLSLYDLSSLSFLESFPSAPLTYTITAGPNPRLAYSAGGGGYGVATDTTIQRDVTRLKGVRAPASTIGAGGKYYLAADYNFVLDVVDTATLQVAKTVDFSFVIPHNGNPGAIVAANNQAYIFPRNQGSPRRAAVVDLSSFQLSSIQLPLGSFCRRCASRTPDGSMVVAIEREVSDGKLHVLLISTSTNTLVQDFGQSGNYNAQAFVVTRSTDPNSLYGYVAASGGSVVAVDLRPNSQTYGQFLPSTSVTLPNLALSDIAISSDGGKLIIPGSPTLQSSGPNVDVVDTAKMLSDPMHALIAQLTVNGGIIADTACTGFFPTTPPNTAPTVTGLSTYQISNDVSHDITVAGTNFQEGAVFTIGSMLNLETSFISSTMLGVHVPDQIPAGQAQDVIVTNPMTNSPPNQQNQSGLLAGKFNILPNPIFQPATVFGTGNQAAVYNYDLNQRSMINVPTNASGDITYGSVFNIDGKEQYLVKFGFNGYYVLPIDLTTNTPASPITLPSAAVITIGQVFAASRDPQTGGPVIYLAWTDTSNLNVSKIDSDRSSRTFNQIVHTFTQSLNGGSYLAPPIMTVGSDGKYAYVWYGSDISYLGIFNLATDAFNNVAYDNLRVQEFQSEIYVTPDGLSLLMAGSRGVRTTVRVFDISNPTSPKSVAELVPVPIPRHGFPYVYNYQVIGKKLYAVDLTGAVAVFNFDLSKGDVSERGYVAADRPQNYSAFGFSADGSYFYAADYFSDLVLVADTNKLEKGGDPTITNIRSPYTPYLMAVSPVPPPLKAATAHRPTRQHPSGEPRESPQKGKNAKMYSPQ